MLNLHEIKQKDSKRNLSNKIVDIAFYFDFFVKIIAQIFNYDKTEEKFDTVVMK